MASEEWLRRLRRKPQDLADAPEDVQGCQEAVLVAVREQPDALGFAAPALRDDPDFVAQCVQVHGSALKYASEVVRANRVVVCAAVKSWPRALQFAAEALRADRGFVLEAVRLGGMALADVAEGLRRDRDVVLAAVKADGLALEFAHEDMRADRAVVLAAIKKTALVLRHTAASVQADPIWQRTAAVRAENKDPAVTSGRVDEVFEGFVSKEATQCIVSFPGDFIIQWDGLVRCCKDKSLCSACVFLPKGDPQQRFGAHSFPDDTARQQNKCYCHLLYGEAKDWGCRWFVDWMKNVERAVELKLDLYVVFFPCEMGEGVVEWGNLASQGERLWNKIGLGGSQKAEVAWLNLMRYPFKSIDVLDANSMLGLTGTSAEVLDLGRPAPGDAVRILEGDHAGKTGKLLDDEGSDQRMPYRVQICGTGAKVWFKESQVRKRH